MGEAGAGEQHQHRGPRADQRQAQAVLSHTPAIEIIIFIQNPASLTCDNEVLTDK